MKPVNQFTLNLPKYVVKDAVKWAMIPAKIVLDGLSLWPENQTPIKVVVSASHFASTIFIMAGQVHHLFEKGLDLATGAFVFILFIALVETIVRQILLVYHRKKIVNLLNMVYYEFWPSKIADEEIEKQLNKTTWFIIIYCCSYALSAFMCAQQMTMGPLITGTRNLPCLSTYPLDWRKSPLYELLYVWQTFAAELVIFIVGGVDMLFVSLLWNCIAQFLLLRAYIQKNFVRSTAHGKDVLLKCLLHHTKLIQACRDMEDIFSYFIMALFLTNVGTICVSSFVLTVIPQAAGSAVTYFLGHICQLFIYCYLGTLLIYESTALSDAVFHCGWHFSEKIKELKSPLVMLILRSQQEQHLTAGGFVGLNLTSFGKIVKLSFSVYTLLKSVMERTDQTN